MTNIFNYKFKRLTSALDKADKVESKFELLRDNNLEPSIAILKEDPFWVLELTVKSIENEEERLFYTGVNEDY